MSLGSVSSLMLSLARSTKVPAASEVVHIHGATTFSCSYLRYGILSLTALGASDKTWPGAWGFLSRPLVSDELWAAVVLLLPEEPPKPKGGRPRCDDRRALEGIVLLLWSSIAWERMLQVPFGCTGRRAGVGCATGRVRVEPATGPRADPNGMLRRLHRVLLERLAATEVLDWSRASIGKRTGPGRRGARRRQPRSARTTRTAAARATQALPLRLRPRHTARLRGSNGANRHDSRMLATVLDGSPACAAARGVPAIGPASSTQTRPTTTAGAGPNVARTRSSHASHAAASSARTGSADTAGSSAPWPSSPTSGASRSDPSVAPRSTGPSPRWPVSSSASTRSDSFSKALIQTPILAYHSFAFGIDSQFE